MGGTTPPGASSGGPAKKEKPPEFNPRWKGYVYLGLTSLVNFASISSIERWERQRYWAASMAFGLLTFAIAVLVLMQDRSQRCLESFHFTKAKNGNVEGGTLLFCVLWWIVGTSYITRAGGIAYVATNIYFSSWLSLFSSVYTLNEWSASKDILSIAELTSISSTLKSWWVLWISSLVVLGTCIDLHVRLGSDEVDDTAFGVAMSITSVVVSFFFILVHYDFIPRCEEGTWFELSSSFFLVLIWTVALAILTQDQGVAATLSGTRCSRDDLALQLGNCTIVIYEQVGYNATGPIIQETQLACNDLPRQVPGSNLYFATWICFFASLNISFRWKAQQALQFAQAQQERRQRQLADSTPGTPQPSSENMNGADDNHMHDDDDDDDDDM